MNKKITTLIMTLAVVLLTAGFSIAEGSMTTGGNFPYFHLGCLIIGGLIITSIHSKFKEMKLIESIGSFALYFIMVTLFTDPVVDTIKLLLS